MILRNVFVQKAVSHFFQEIKFHRDSRDFQVPFVIKGNQNREIASEYKYIPWTDSSRKKNKPVCWVIFDSNTK